LKSDLREREFNLIQKATSSVKRGLASLDVMDDTFGTWGALGFNGLPSKRGPLRWLLIFIYKKFI
jgi:hypothetical protein